MADDLNSAGADLYWYPIGFSDAATLEMGKQYGVFIDQTKFSTVRRMKSAIAHEIGHCATGCTHKVSSPLDLIEKHEYEANRWKIEHYLPFEVLNDAMKRGYVESWALADYFDVPEEDIIMAVRYYINRRGMKFG